jgi:hypothetical protein
MFIRARTTLLVSALVLITSTSMAADVLVEAESFKDPGGWVLDPQFLDTMGSPYLLAHGLGKPVENASTEIEFPESGEYAVWVRTKDWIEKWSPGRFKLLVDDKELQPVFGVGGEEWAWHRGGTIDVKNRRVRLELHDLTGFDGRCDAILFTTDQNLVPPNQPGPSMEKWRKTLLGLPVVPPMAGQFDVVVVGGGIPGCAAALSAARLGCKVALIQNRPVLGGNGSSEVGILPRGTQTSLVMELVARGPDHAILAERVLRAEENVSLFLNYHALRAEIGDDEDKILSVDAINTSTNHELRFVAPCFIDCTGRAAIGLLVGAECRIGREPRAEFNESLAPEKADAMHHGNTLPFHTQMADHPVAFPDVPWATVISKDYADLGGQIRHPGLDNLAGPVGRELRNNRTRSSPLTHFWEYGQWLDPYEQAEQIRDHLLRAVYGTFATVKQQSPEVYANLELDYVGHVPATGEFRRLIGDYILTENDIRQQRSFPDVVAIGSGHFCLHYPGDKYDFRLGDWQWHAVKPYQVPLRCLYSRNIDNLMMAGKHISVSHVAGSCTKFMLNGGQHGQAVGAVAFLCKKYNTTPRGVAEDHLQELRALLLRFR